MSATTKSSPAALNRRTNNLFIKARWEYQFFLSDWILNLKWVSVFQFFCLPPPNKSSPADLNTIQRKTNILHWSEETCAQKSNVFSWQFEMNAEERQSGLGILRKSRRVVHIARIFWRSTPYFSHPRQPFLNTIGFWHHGPLLCDLCLPRLNGRKMLVFACF